MNSRSKKINSYTLWIIPVTAVLAFIFLYLQVSSSVNNNSRHISELQSQLTSFQDKLSASNSLLAEIGDNISNLSVRVAAGSSQISSIAGQAASGNFEISSLSQQVNSTNSRIGALTGQISLFGSQILEAQSQLTSIQGNVTALRSQLDSLETMVNAITTPVTLFSSLNVIQGPGAKAELITFTPAYSGFVSISGITGSLTGYILIVNNSTNTSKTLNFASGTTIYTPLTGGVSYTIYFGNSDSSGSITANLMGTFQL